jgi:hypothetical protein
MVSCDLPSETNASPRLELAEYHDISEYDTEDDDAASTFSDHGSLHSSPSSPSLTSPSTSSPSSAPVLYPTSPPLSPATSTGTRTLPLPPITVTPHYPPSTSWFPSWPFGGKKKLEQPVVVEPVQEEPKKKIPKKIVRVWYPSKTQISLRK